MIGPRTLLAYAVLEREELSRSLLGAELTVRMWRRRLERWRHGRW